MAWRVVITDSVWPDLERFDDPSRAIDEITEWIANGPPCEGQRRVGAAVVYEHTLESGIRVQYFIGTYPRAYVAILRIRPPIVRPPE